MKTSLIEDSENLSAIIELHRKKQYAKSILPHTQFFQMG